MELTGPAWLSHADWALVVRAARGAAAYRFGKVSISSDGEIEYLIHDDDPLAVHRRDRGRVSLGYRAGSVSALVPLLVQLACETRGLSELRSPWWLPPPGWAISGDRAGMTLQRGDLGGAVFTVAPLHSTLTWAWVLSAAPGELEASADSADGAPLFKDYVGRDPAAPLGSVLSVEEWQDWLAVHMTRGEP